MARPAKGKANGKAKSGGRRKVRAPKAAAEVARDVFSDEEDAAAEQRMNAQMDVDGVYEYEAPETFAHDSEIEEDAAFDSQDEADYGMFFQSKTAKGKPKRGQAEPSDSEDEEEQEEGGDLLSDFLGTAPAARLPTADSDAEPESEDEDDGDDAAKLANLQSLVDGLVPELGKPKKLADIDTSVLKSSSGAALSALGGGGALTLGNLLGTVEKEEEKSAVNLAKVKKQMRELETDGSAALHAAVAPVLEERAARKTAYAEKKEEMDVFLPVVRRNRQKETLDLRQQGPKLDTLTSAALTSKFSAQTDLEKSVADLLRAGDLSDRAVAKDEREELERKQVSVLEVQQRQKELAKLRALMFYEEQKQKRIKKIKSKLYHKIRNSQDKKAAEKQRKQLRELDPELAQKLDDEMAEKRAEERLTLKHTNTSKWVKHQLKRGVLADNDTRTAIAEQLRRGDELRRKMNAVDSDEDGDDEEDGDEDMEEDAVTRLQKRLTKQANALITEIDDDAANAGKVKGLHGMKFMQRAVEKQREKARSEAEKLLRELRGDGEGLLSDGENYINSDDEDGVREKSKKQKHIEKKKSVEATADDREAVSKALPKGALQVGSVSMDTGLSARASGAIAVDLGDGVATASTEVAVGATDAPTLELGANGKSKNGKSKKEQSVPAPAASTEPTADAEEQGGENPWLSSTATKEKKRTGKKAKQLAKKQQSGADVASAIDALAKSVEMNVDATATTGKKRKLETEAAADATPVSDDSKSTQKKSKTSKDDTNNKAAPTQDELVRRAFAFADEDEDDIAREKEALADADTQVKKGAEIAKLVGMSGWGSWAGDGVKTSWRQTQREKQAAKLAADTKKAVLANRKDAKMSKVLINEKKDKRAAKFTVAEIPYPFKSREEYELAMRNPLGSDWNTPSATNKLTAPKIMKRSGTIIQPLVLTKEDKKMAKKELSKQRKAKF